MSIGSGEWYVRTRGRVLGPFNRSQLATMRDRGQLTPDLEVSQDRRSWIKAAELPGIFAKADEAQAPQKAASNTEWPALRDEPGTGSVARTADVLPSWFVARGESHQGPLGIADLQRMFAAGEIGPSSLVWKDGMPNWLPVSQVPDLQYVATPGAPVGSAAGSSPYSTPSPGSHLDPQYQTPRTSGLAIASLVLGLLPLCGISSLLATIFGAVALSQISRSNGSIIGRGLALAGLILGILGLVAGILLVVVFLLGSGLGGREPRF
jgi:hypothetical protein